MSSASPSFTPTEQNKLLIHRWFEEVWNQGRRETIFELWADGAILHDGPKQVCGAEEFSAFYDAMRAQFSGFQFTPILSLADGDLVCLHWSCSATHIATHKAVQITGTSILRVENGRFAEAWQNWDAAHLSAQLGA